MNTIEKYIRKAKADREQVEKYLARRDELTKEIEQLKAEAMAAAEGENLSRYKEIMTTQREKEDEVNFLSVVCDKHSGPDFDGIKAAWDGAAPELNEAIRKDLEAYKKARRDLYKQFIKLKSRYDAACAVRDELMQAGGIIANGGYWKKSEGETISMTDILPIFWNWGELDPDIHMFKAAGLEERKPGENFPTIKRVFKNGGLKIVG